MLVFIVKFPFWVSDGRLGLGGGVGGVGGVGVVIVHTEGYPKQLYPEEIMQLMHPGLLVPPESQAYLSLIKPSPQILWQVPSRKLYP